MEEREQGVVSMSMRAFAHARARATRVLLALLYELTYVDEVLPNGPGTKTGSHA